MTTLSEEDLATAYEKNKKEIEIIVDCFYSCDKLYNIGRYLMEEMVEGYNKSEENMLNLIVTRLIIEKYKNFYSDQRLSDLITALTTGSLAKIKIAREKVENDIPIMFANLLDRYISVLETNQQQ